jgi:uroporphyrinogen decarboxylase
MTPKQRVRAALDHRQPDRVPLDIGGTHDTTLLEESFLELRKLLGTTGAARPANRWLGSVFPDEQALKRLGSDFRAVALPAPDYQVRTQRDGTRSFTDEWGITWTRRPGSFYFDVLKFHTVENLSDVERLPWPEPSTGSKEWKTRLEGLRAQARKIERNGYAAVLDFGVAPMTMTQLLVGFEESCVLLVTAPDILRAMMEKVLEIYMAQAEGVFAAVGSQVDAVYAFADDLGTQNSLWLSPGQYRSIVKPFHRRIVDFIKTRSSAKVIFHSCGAIADYIPDLLDIGIDALNPVQVSAAGMDPEFLKKEYGSDLVFWGGIDTQQVLPRGTPEQVREEVRRRIDVLGRGGGYVISAVHNIQPDVPAENVLAMAQEAVRYRAGVSEV